MDPELWTDIVIVVIGVLVAVIAMLCLLIASS